MRYCWPTYVKVLGVLCLGEVSSTFLPSKKACWAHQFQYLGVGQQYPGVFRDFLKGCVVLILFGVSGVSPWLYSIWHGPRLHTPLPCPRLLDHLVRLEQQRQGDGQAEDFLPFVNPNLSHFLPHLHDRLTTNPAGIIACTMTQHGHQDTQESVTNIA